MMSLDLSTTRHRLLVGVIAVCLAVLLASTVPLQINPALDFSQFYVDLFGVLRGDAIYDYLAHAQRYAESARAAPLNLNPPVYPPWYYVLFLPLGAFSMSTSATLWAWMNLALFFCAIEPLTARLSISCRAALVITCLFFGPLVGHIVVGQQAVILLPGVALVIRGIELRSSPKTAFGLLLLTFKPHLGLPIAGAAVLLLLLRYSPLAVSTIVRFLAGFVLLLALSVLIDPRSLIEYPESLQRLSTMSLNQVCDTCSSLALSIQRTLNVRPEWLWMERFVISALVWLVLILPMFIAQLSDRAFISASICVVLLAAPYIRNYDYVLLLAPLVGLIEEDFIGRRSKQSGSVARKFMCLVGFLIAGIGPLFASRETHASFLWIAAAVVYVACFTRRKS